MYVIKARTGSFTFTLTALGWQRDDLAGGYPPARFNLHQADEVADYQRSKTYFDIIWPSRHTQ